MKVGVHTIAVMKYLIGKLHLSNKTATTKNSSIIISYMLKLCIKELRMWEKINDQPNYQHSHIDKDKV